MTPEILNAIIVGGAVIFAIIGLAKGIIKQLGSLVALVLGVIAGRLFGAELADYLDWNVFVASAVVAIVVYLVVIILAKVLKATVHKLMLGPVDRLLGGVFGVLFWLSLSSLILNLIIICAPETELPASQLVQWTFDFLPWVIGCAALYI